MTGAAARGGAPEVRGRRVTVMGLGLFGGGAGAARWALRQGARVTVTDLRDEALLAREANDLRALAPALPPRFVFGRHEARDFEDADVVIVNPAVPPASPWLARARAAGATITTSEAILLQSLRARVVAITGTNGKSSTSRFTGELLRRGLVDGARVAVGGNIGGSLLDDAPSFGPGDVVVLELSSYQLQHLPDALLERDLPFADVAAITNVGVDHLERHGTIDAYRNAKLRIVDLVGADGVAIVPPGPLEEAATERLGRACRTHGPGAEVALDASGCVRFEGEILGRAEDLRVRGRFQRDNLVTALAAAHALGAVPERLLGAVGSLDGLPHRMESIGTFALRPGGPVVEIVDNGVSTTPESTLAAVDSFEDRSAKVLVAGGQVKRGVDEAALAERLAQKGWTLVPFGAAAPALAAAARAAGAPVEEGPCETAEEAARVAIRVAADRRAAVVLFSPACASFDRYPNFAARAGAFRTALRACLPAVRGEPSPPEPRYEATER